MICTCHKSLGLASQVLRWRFKLLVKLLDAGIYHEAVPRTSANWILFYSHAAEFQHRDLCVLGTTLFIRETRAVDAGFSAMCCNVIINDFNEVELHRKCVLLFFTAHQSLAKHDKKATSFIYLFEKWVINPCFFLLNFWLRC